MAAPDDETLTIGRLTPDQEPALMAFLRAHPGATVFHEPWWFKVLSETYGHRCDYWMAWEGTQTIRGVFPIVTLRVPFLGRKMVALPYQYHCGAPLANSEHAFSALLDQAKETAHRTGVSYVELRSFCELTSLEKHGLMPVDTRLSKTIVPLQGLDIRNLREGHRKELRKAMAAGTRIERDPTLEGLRVFWNLYRLEGRQLGGPRAGWRYFCSLYNHAGDRYRLWLAREGPDCIGGLLTLDDGAMLFARNGAYTNPRAKAARLGRALIWQSMVDAASRGCSRYDLGISSVEDKGLVEFKEGWQGITQPVMAYVLPVKSTAPQAGSYFEGYQLAKAVWRGLPMPIVDRLGHQITRWIA
jgi:Acetyltransferase (GNAT) domain